MRFIVLFYFIIISPIALAGNLPCESELDLSYKNKEKASTATIDGMVAHCLELALYPLDVRNFLKREMDCIHWAGEEPYSKERQKEIEQGMVKSNCSQIEEDKEKMINKYKEHKQIKRALKFYADRVYSE